MQRRTFLKGLAVFPFVPRFVVSTLANAARSRGRVRPGEPGWPGPAEWARLRRAVGGRLVEVESPFVACAGAPAGATCTDLFQSLGNPFFIGDNVALTQTLGWTGAWTSAASEYAVVARGSADIAAAVNFARKHRLRLVVKGAGHSYIGGSNAPDSLLIWTRAMRTVELHGSFVPRGGEGLIDPEPAVSVGAGAIWLDVYEAVTTKGGRYAQGGGCTTVGVAGFIQGGGFGSFSKGFGTGAASLLEAEVVTADGAVRVVNAVRDPDLFWALKGGGGGTFGVLSRLTLRTHPLPNYAGEVHATITAASDAAYRALVERVISFYRTSLMNPHWGEQISFEPVRQISISMVFHGVDQAQAEQTWAPLFDWVTARPADYTLANPTVLAIPAKDFWNPAVLEQIPGLITTDDRPGAPKSNFFWANNKDEAGEVLHAYQSTWLSKRLLAPERRAALVHALVHASQSWQVTLHCNKGLAGAPADALRSTGNTAMNPAVLDAFALAIAAANEPPAYPGVAGHEPHLAQGRRDAKRVAAAMAPLKALAAQPTSYVNETDYFQHDWQTAFWGNNYPRLLRIKDRYDPTGLFFVHHGVGSEAWSPDGFTMRG
jgi:FAD/FMN-containing dehydrogenase